MKKLLPLLAALAIFTGCEKIEGQLNVTKDVKLVNSTKETKTLKVGTYSADIKANTKKSISLRLNNDNSEKYIFNIPNGSLPENGNFNYSSSVVGQPVDLSGTIATVVTQSERRQATESCQYQEPVQICQPGPNGQMYCSIQYQTRFGTRWIEYYDRKTDKDVTLSIAAKDSGVESAQFQGSADTVERVVLSQSQCRYY